MFSSDCLKILDGISLYFLYFFEFWKSFLKDFTLIHCCWVSFTIGYFLFYSVILGFLGYHRFPSFVVLGTITNVVLASLVANPFLIPHYFLLLRFLLQKPLVDFPILGGPRRLVIVPSFFKASRFHFFKPTFWLHSLLSLFPGELTPSLLGSSSWVPQGTRVLVHKYWFPSHLTPFLHH